MIKVTVIALSRLKEAYLREACGEYEKRLSRYCDLRIVEIEPAKLPEKPSETEIASALEREADAIVKRIPAGTMTVAMCIEGKEMSSGQFADIFGSAAASGKGVTLIIGSSYGLSEKIKQRCDMRLSVSKMTFPHQLFRIMLLEQIYRGFKINCGGTYHK